MELKYVIPKVKETFGTLYFGSEKAELRERGRNGKVISRTYNLFSDVQRADDVEVTLPAEAGDKEKILTTEQRIELVNPKITAVGYRIGEQAFVRYTCYANDIKTLNTHTK